MLTASFVDGDHTELFEHSARQLAEVAPEYTATHLLGEGGGGVVLRAEGPGGPVATKLISPNSAKQEAAVWGINHEAEVLRTVRGPHVVQLLEYRWSPTQPLLVLELLDSSFADTLTGQPTDPASAWAAGLAVCLGLARLHDHDYIHLDLKPRNVGLTQSREPCVMDMGHAYDPRRWRRKLPLATLTYTAPEQLRQGRVGKYTDSWGLGLFLYVLLAGQLPGDRLRSWRDAFKRGAVVAEPLTCHVADMPPQVVAAVGQLLTHDPAARPQTGRECADLLTTAGTATWGAHWWQNTSYVVKSDAAT